VVVVIMLVVATRVTLTIPTRIINVKSAASLGTHHFTTGSVSASLGTQHFTTEKMVNVASSSTSYNHDLAWYANSAATDHTTSDLDKLTMTENYAGPDQVHIANGAGMMIKHICHSIISTPCR
jgi:hypothetical protein